MLQLESGEVETLLGIARSLRADAEGFKISTPEERIAAGELLVSLRTERKMREARMDEIIAPAHAAWKAATKLRKDLTDPLTVGEKVLSAEMSRFDIEDEKRRRLLEERIGKEQQALNEDAALAAAGELEAAGLHAEAEAVLEEAAHAHAPVIALRPAKAEGESARKKWKYRIVNALGVTPAYLIPNEKEIAKTVTALGPAAEGIVGGIEVFEVREYAVR